MNESNFLRTAALLLLGLGLAGCAAAATTGDSQELAPPRPTSTPQPAVELPDLGPAPDITNELWLNSDQPLNLAALRGKVVLVEFWTFG